MGGKSEVLEHQAVVDEGSVAVIIPVYNGAHFVAKAIESVLSQTHPAAQILVIDDGSTDNLRAVVSEYGAAVTLVSQPNGGLSNARNAGIRLARSRYVAFLDADDWWHPRKLEVQLAAMQANPIASGNYTGVIIVNSETGNALARRLIYPAELALAVQWCNPGVPPSSVLLTKQALDEVGYFNESIRACEDWDLWFRLCKAHQLLTISPEPLTFYLDSPGSMSGDADHMFEMFMLILDSVLLKHLRGWKRWIWRRRVISFQAYKAILTSRTNGKAHRELAYMWKSLSVWPSPFWAPERFKVFAATLLHSSRAARASRKAEEMANGTDGL